MDGVRLESAVKSDDEPPGITAEKAGTRLEPSGARNLQGEGGWDSQSVSYVRIVVSEARRELTGAARAC